MADLSIGDYKTFPYYAVIGTPTDFYIWIKLKKDPGWGWYVGGSQGASGWIKGQEAFKYYNKMKEFLDKGQKDRFMGLAAHLHRTFKGTV